MIRDTASQDEVIERAPRFTRRRLVVAVALASAFGAVAAVAPSLERWGSAERSVTRERLRLATVEFGDLQRDVSAQGVVVAAVKPTLFSPAPGVVSLQVQPGDRVGEGQVVARIASPELRNALDQAAASLARAEIAFRRQQIDTRQRALDNQRDLDLAGVELTAARRELQRAEAAHAKQAISGIDLAKARDDLAAAELRHAHATDYAQLQTESLAFELEAAEQEIELQRLQVEELERQVARLDVRSPVTGVVGNLLVAEADAVPRDAPLLTVVDLTAFEVELKVPDAYGSALTPGLAAEVTHQGDRWPARVVSISPEVIGNQVTTRVRFEGAAPDNMRQNQRVTASILLEGKADVVMVDRGPFLESSAGRYTYVVEGDLATRRRIETGLVSVNRVEILAGLEPGERVVVSSLDDFDDAEVVYLSN